MFSFFNRSMIAIWLAHLLLDFMLSVWPVYKTLAKIDLKIAGLIAGVGMFLGEGMQLVFGYLSDRGFCKELIISGLLLMGGAAFFSHVQGSFFLFMLIFCTYLGSSAFHPAAIGIIGQSVHERTGIFLALFFTSGTIGAAISQVVFSKVYLTFHGHTWFLLLPILVICLLLIFVRFPGQKESHSRLGIREVVRLLAPYKVRFAMLFSIQVLFQVVLLSFLFLLPDALQTKGVPSWVYYGGGNTFFILGAAMMGYPAGLLLERYDSRAVLFLITVFSCLIFYLFLIYQGGSVVTTALLLLCLGGGMGVLQPLIVSTARESSPKEISSIVGGIFLGVAGCVASLGVIATGAIAGAFSTGGAIVSLEICGALFPVVLLLLLLTKSSDHPSEALVVATSYQ